MFEAILALAVFIIAVVGIAHIFFGANYSVSYSVERSKAMLLTREGIEAVRSIRDNDFEDLSEDSFGVIGGEQWQFTTATDYDMTDGFTRQINITQGLDYDTWQVDASVTWTAITGSEGEVSLTEYLTAWPFDPVAVTCGEHTTYFASGCDLLLEYDTDDDGEISTSELLAAGDLYSDAGDITESELTFVSDAWDPGPINTLCPGCY